MQATSELLPQTTVRLSVSHSPSLQRREEKELCKQVKKIAEEGKVAVRNVRRDAMEKFKAMKKNSEITEDDLKNCEKDVQKLTDKYCDEMDAACSAKEKKKS